MLKAKKRMAFIGALLILFTGIFSSIPVLASTPIQIDPMCITGAPNNTITYRLNQPTRPRGVVGANAPGSQLPQITSGHFTRPTGPPPVTFVGGIAYRQVRNHELGLVFVRVSALTQLATC